MKTKYKLIIVFGLFVLVLFFQGYKEIKQKYKNTNRLSFQEVFWNYSFVDTPDAPLVDGAIYGDDAKDIEVEKLYITVLPTHDEDKGPILFSDMNAIMDYNSEIPIMKAVVSRDGLTAADTANAVITLRGHSTIASPEKSFKIKLDSNTERWYGQDTINLSKHPFDDFRVRNKIAFDLFERIPNMTSMKTRFVNLFVKDLSAEGNGEYIDYGLFTNIEKPDKTFLKEHQLDENGTLYKANYFEFYRYPEDIKNSSDPDYDVTLFEGHLEINLASSHDKIINMIEEVNNPLLDSDKVLEKNFNKDNYFTWLATNILLGNYDTQTQNFLLYSPHDVSTWYFLPWDYDGSMDAVSDMQKDAEGNYVQLVGISNYWNSVLHARVFKNQHYLEELNQKIEEVYKIISPITMQSEIDKYLPVIGTYFLSDPEFLEDISLEQFEENVSSIKNITTKNRELYYQTIEKPMPIFLGDIESNEEGNIFRWSDSYDLQGDAISYTLQVSKEPNFSSLEFNKSGLTDLSFIVKLAPGDYFWRVIVTDAKGETQRAFDIYDAGAFNFYYGLKKITIN